MCPYCGVGCGIEILTHDGEIIGAEPDFTAASRGSLCVKGQFASWEFVRSEDRLRHPLIKQADGTFRKASWDDALDLVSSKFKDAIADEGPDSVVCWASARVVTEANYLMQKFARIGIGTNNIDKLFSYLTRSDGRRSGGHGRKRAMSNRSRSWRAPTSCWLRARTLQRRIRSSLYG